MDRLFKEEFSKENRKEKVVLKTFHNMNCNEAKL
jgi:hypothetical protein